MLLRLLAGVALAGLLTLVLINAFRPDQFRFESVGPTMREAVLSALDARLALLDNLPYERLAELAEEQDDRVRIDDRDVLFHTMRTTLPDGLIEIRILAAVREPAGILSRPIRVAARGFRIGSGQARVPLTEEELTELAMNVSSAPFYER